MHLSNLEGIIGSSFRIGYNDETAIIQDAKTVTDEDGHTSLILSINATLQVNGVESSGDAPLTSGADAKNDEDLVNLKNLNAKLKETVTAASDYTDEKIKELTGGTTGANIMMLPMNLTVENLEDGYSNAFGKLAANKFIDRVIFEVTEPFVCPEGEKYDISIGTYSNPEYLVPKFSVENLFSTYIVNIFRTLDAETDFVLYITKHVEEVAPDPEPEEPAYEQRVYCDHDGVSTSITSDASGKIWNVDISGADLNAEVKDTETFDDQNGTLMDFGINLPVEANHRYRIMQRNPALAFYTSDPYVGESGGIYTKDKNYTTGEDETEFIYKFVLTESSGDNDYIHIWFYDLDGDDPDTAALTFHIKNDLSFRGSSGPNALLQHDFLSANEGSVGIVQNADNQYTITLDGEIHSKESVVSASKPGLSGNLTDFAVFYPKIVTDAGLRIAIYNPVYSQLAGNDDSVHSSDGVYYAEVNVAVDAGSEVNGFWIDIPVGDDTSYPIVIAVVDLGTNENFTIGIDNQLTFLPEEVEETEETSSSDEATIMPAAYNLEAVAVSEEADDSEEESEEPTLAVTPAGKVKVRIMSF